MGSKPQSNPTKELYNIHVCRSSRRYVHVRNISVNRCTEQVGLNLIGERLEILEAQARWIHKRSCSLGALLERARDRFGATC